MTALPTLANYRTLPGYRDTYTISSGSPDTLHGEPRGFITDALNGRVTARYPGGYRVPLDTELCGGCDAPVEDGPCGCMTKGEQ